MDQAQPAGQFARARGRQDIDHRFAGNGPGLQAKRALHGRVYQQDPISLIGHNDGVRRAGQDRRQSPAAALSGSEEMGILHEHGCLPGERFQQALLRAIEVMRLAVDQVHHSLELSGRHERQGIQCGRLRQAPANFGFDLGRRGQHQLRLITQPQQNRSVEWSHAAGRGAFRKDPGSRPAGIAHDCPHGRRAGAAQDAL